MIDATPLRAALELDGYAVEVTQTGERVTVLIAVGRHACADCLAPEPVLKGIAADLLGVAQERIDLTYPDPER